MNKILKLKEKIKKNKWYVIAIMAFCVLFIASGVVGCIFYANIQQLKQENSDLQDAIVQKDMVTKENQSEIDDNMARLSELTLQLDENTTQLEMLGEELSAAKTLLKRKEELAENGGNSFSEEEMFDKIVYLTFDDGPSSNTTRILEILKAEGVKATFFVNYNSYAFKNGLYKQIVDAGHSIGNHTYSHIMATSNWDEFYEDFFKMEDFIYEQTGVRPKIFRYPGGSKRSWANTEKNTEGAGLLADMGYVHFDWNVSNNDSDSDAPQMSAEQMEAYVIYQSKGRKIINLLMHDRSSKNATVNSLRNIIDYYKDNDYVFLPITAESIKIQTYKAAD